MRAQTPDRDYLDDPPTHVHSDKRYRPSLASDLIEPVRPFADRIAFELLRDREFNRGEVVETRQGVCRLGAGLARSLAVIRARCGRRWAVC